MAVLSVDEEPEAEAGWDELWRRTYDRHYRVECDSRTDTEVTLRTATTSVVISGVPTTVPWLPRIGYTFAHLLGATIDSGAFLQSVAYRRTRCGANPEGSTWLLDCHYGPFNTSMFGSDPLQWPTRINFKTQTYERVLYFDADGVPIANSAGCRYEDPCTADDGRAVITVTRNERMKTVPASGGDPSLPGFDFTLAATFANTTNLGTWNGFAERCVKCQPITTGDSQYDTNHDVWFFEVTYVFEVNLDTWDFQPIDQGFRERILGVSAPITVKGQEVDEPQFLNGSGLRLPDGGTPVHLRFKRYASLDFSPLNIDFAAVLGL